MNTIKVLMRISSDVTEGIESRYWKVDTGFREDELLEEEAEIVAEELATTFGELHDAEVSWRIE